jgi:hypothetical protein
MTSNTTIRLNPIVIVATLLAAAGSYLNLCLALQLEDESKRNVEDKIRIIIEKTNERIALQHQLGANKQRKSEWQWHRAKTCVEADYMGPYPLFDDKQFARVFRVDNNGRQTNDNLRL